MDEDRIVFNKQDSVVWKPAHVPDTVNPARVSPEELRESRKDHQKSVVVTVYHTWGKADLPGGAYQLRHAGCDTTTTASGFVNPRVKHSVRYNRSARRT